MKITKQSTVLLALIVLLVNSTIIFYHTTQSGRSELLMSQATRGASSEDIGVRPLDEHIQNPSTRMAEFDYWGDDVRIRDVDYGEINGISMRPAIWDGNTVISKRYQPSSYDIGEGDIVRFVTTDEQPVIHQVVATYPEYLLTQGLNNERGEKISREQVTHVVVGVLYT